MKTPSALLMIGCSIATFAGVVVWMVSGEASSTRDPSTPDTQAPEIVTQGQTDSDHHEGPQLVLMRNDPAPVRTDKLIFSDGEEFPIHWRAAPYQRVDVSPPFADDYYTLREMAENGDAAAAYTLWQILDGCKYGFSDRESLEAAMKTLNETHTIKMPAAEESVLLMNPGAIENWKKVLPIFHQQCEGITLEHKSRKLEWLERAALSGHTFAMLQMSGSIESYARGVEFDQARWAGGDANALRDLAIRYYGSYQSGEIPENKIRFYAALYAFSQIAFTKYSREKESPHGNYRHAQDELSAATQELLPHEIDQAIAMAEDILRANQNCCFDF